MNEMYVQPSLLPDTSPAPSCTPAKAGARKSVISRFDPARTEHSHSGTKSSPCEHSDATDVEASVTEIIIAKNKADNVQLLLPMLTHLHKENRWLAWIDPPIELLKKWRTDSGTDGRDIMILRSGQDLSATTVAEKALAAGTCHAVILWTQGLSNESFDTLEQASAIGDSHCIVLRSR